MWYRFVKHRVAALNDSNIFAFGQFNVASPVANPAMPETLPLEPDDALTSVGDNDNNITTPENGASDDVLPPRPTTQNMMVPPLHNLCRCKIINMPGGNQIWKTNENSCAMCLEARDIFNRNQAQEFGFSDTTNSAPVVKNMNMIL